LSAASLRNKRAPKDDFPARAKFLRVRAKEKCVLLFSIKAFHCSESICHRDVSPLVHGNLLNFTSLTFHFLQTALPREKRITLKAKQFDSFSTQFGKTKVLIVANWLCG
jgi:hypothetical protein